MSDLTVANRGFNFEDALDLVLGYAFQTTKWNWTPNSLFDADRPTAGHRARWAYRTYDCIPPAPGPALTGVDLLVADGINAQMRARSVASLIAAAPAVSRSLAAIPPGTTFWDLKANEVTEPPALGTPA